MADRTGAALMFSVRQVPGSKYNLTIRTQYSRDSTGSTDSKNQHNQHNQHNQQDSTTSSAAL
jgi:hypothetical protein